MLTWLWAWPLDRSRQAHPAGELFMTAPCLDMLLLYLLAMGTLHAQLVVYLAQLLVLPSVYHDSTYL